MQAKRLLRDFSAVLALLLIGGVFAALSPEFLSPRNLSMLMIELSTTALLALGMFLVILPGHIDLSVGSGVGLIGGIASVLVFRHHWPAPAAMLLAAGVAVAVWTAMGSIVIKQKMPAFIITLGGLLVFKGLFWLVIRNATVPVSQGGTSNLYSLLTTYYLPPAAGLLLAAAAVAALAWQELRPAAGPERRRDGASGVRPARRPAAAQEGRDFELRFLGVFVSAQLLFLFVLVMNRFRGVPLPIVILAAAALAVVVLTEHTPFGRYLYAIGGNEEAAVLSGIPVDRVVISAFAVMGAVTAATGFLQTAYAGASTTTVGELMELDAVAACVIGGTSLKGGRGTALGVLFGALIMATLLNGMTLLAVSPEFKFIARGLVLSLAVWLDTRLNKA
ncbi:MAG: ATPase [Elusimicrobia bacterium]|nr:ATPase [Elusimicrobiota bacterium]